MTTSTNTTRQRRRTAKAPDGTSPANAAAEAQDAGRTRRKPTKPPAEAGPATSAPADSAAEAQHAAGTKRKPTKPPAEAGPATSAPANSAAEAQHAAGTKRKPTKSAAVAGPATTAPADATVGRTRRKATKPAAVAGPATMTADAAPAEAEATEPSVAWPSPEMRPWSAVTGLRLVDRIERGVAEPPTEPRPAPPATLDLAAPQVYAAPPNVAPRLAPDHDRRGVAATPDAEGPPIGATEARLFDCPKCSRPLTRGTSRCPGCGVRLLRGVALRRVGVFLAAGIAVSLAVGGGFAAVAMAVGGQTPSSSPLTPTARPTATPARSVVAVPVGPPAGALAALGGTAVVNGRISVDAGTLAATLAKKGATTIEIARAIRSLAADAALGIEQTSRLTQWADAAPVMTQLDDFYRSIAQTARVALRASLADASGYRRSGARMLAVLDGLGGVDAASRTLAATVGLELPPVPPTVP
jgi:hypothetical protein